MRRLRRSADCVIVKADGADQSRSAERTARVWGVGGGSARDKRAGDVSGLGEKGSDFLVLDSERSPGALLNEENVTKVLSVSPSIEEAYLRILEDVPIDCVLIEHGIEGELLISDLMTLRSIMTAVSKPCLVRVRPGLTEGELSALRHVGALGVVVDVNSKGDAAELPRLREAIDVTPTEGRGRASAGGEPRVSPGAFPGAQRPRRRPGRLTGHLSDRIWGLHKTISKVISTSPAPPMVSALGGPMASAAAVMGKTPKGMIPKLIM